MSLSKILVAALVALTVADPATASVTITFSGGASDTIGTPGNVAAYSSGGINVQASAWSFNGVSNETAFLGQYVDGLGVTNISEGNGSAAGQSAIDNKSGNDLVLLVFDQPVSLLSATLTPVQHGNSQSDNDATIAYATLAGAMNFSFTSSSSIWDSLGDTRFSVLGNNSAPFSTLISTGVNYGNVWFVSADVLGLDRSADAFRLSSITVNTQSVPEPSTWILGLLGLSAVGLVLRGNRVRTGILQQIA